MYPGFCSYPRMARPPDQVVIAFERQSVSVLKRRGRTGLCRATQGSPKENARAGASVVVSAGKARQRRVSRLRIG